MGIRRFCITLLLSTAAFAQTPPLTFEVASIKPAGALDPVAIASGKMRIGMKVDGAICDIASFSLHDLIRTACELKDYQITGPDWLGTPMSAQRFNLQATMPEGATEKQVPQMLQALLADRFKLVFHRESKEHSVYALIVGKGGSKLRNPSPMLPLRRLRKNRKKARPSWGKERPRCASLATWRMEKARW